MDLVLPPRWRFHLDILGGGRSLCLAGMQHGTQPAHNMAIQSSRTVCVGPGIGDHCWHFCGSGLQAGRRQPMRKGLRQAFPEGVLLWHSGDVLVRSSTKICCHWVSRPQRDWSQDSRIGCQWVSGPQRDWCHSRRGDIGLEIEPDSSCCSRSELWSSHGRLPCPLARLRHSGVALLHHGRARPSGFASAPRLEGWRAAR